MSGRVCADAIDAAVGGGENLQAQSRLLKGEHFSGQWNAAFDLTDKAADGGSLVILGRLEAVAEKRTELVHREAARKHPRAAVFALRGLEGDVGLVLITDFADDLLQ